MKLQLRDVALLKCRVRTMCLNELSQTVEGLALYYAASNRQGVTGAEPVFEMLQT